MPARSGTLPGYTTSWDAILGFDLAARCIVCNPPLDNARDDLEDCPALAEEDCLKGHLGLSNGPSIGATIQRKLRRVGLPETALGDSIGFTGACGPPPDKAAASCCHRRPPVVLNPISRERSRLHGPC